MSRPPLVFRPSPEPPEPARATGPVLPASSTWSSELDVDLQRPPTPVPARSHSPAPVVLDDDGLDAFAPEQEIRYQTPHPPTAPGSGAKPALLAVAALAAAAVVVMGYMFFVRSGGGSSETARAVTATGQAHFDSQPPGADVIVDGEPRGKTPLKLSLPVGAHTLEVRSDAGSRSLPLTIEPGIVVSQYFELKSAPAVATGRLDITSDPPGAQVSLDGAAKGVTPLTLDAVEAREHIVSLTRGGSTVYRTVRVEAGARASIVASMGSTSPAAVGGYLALSVPFEVQVFEGGKLIGTSSSERLMMPAGRHQLELVNTPLQFRTTVNVNIEAGRIASPAIAIPEGTLSVNALPWAEVTIDGRAVGTTPLANIRLPIGSHEIVWRHPQLGERQQTVAVSSETPVRVGVNFGQ